MVSGYLLKLVGEGGGEGASKHLKDETGHPVYNSTHHPLIGGVRVLSHIWQPAYGHMIVDLCFFHACQFTVCKHSISVALLSSAE